MKNKSDIFNLGLAFSDIASRNAKGIAIKHIDEEAFSFAQLEARANQIAHFLLDHSVQRNEVVAILNNKSSTSYAIMLACLKIGAIYTNIDPKSPEERYDKMIRICEPKLTCFFEDQKLLTYDSDLETVQYDHQNFLNRLKGYPNTLPSINSEVGGSDPAYIMFTSGSTGFSKRSSD